MLLDFPELRQIYNYDCGACALASVLAYYGIDVREDTIMQIAGTDDDGTPMNGVRTVVYYYGLQSFVVHSIDDIKHNLDCGRPVILALQAYKESEQPYNKCWDDGHYVVAIGYQDDRIYFEDPSSYKRTWLTFTELRDRWHDLEGGAMIRNWGLTVWGIPQYKRGDSVHME